MNKSQRLHLTQQTELKGMKEYEGLINYLTNIILRPYRETYGVEKLGPPKFVVKSHEKSISMLESMSKNEKHLPKQIHQTYCQLIEVNRKQATIKRDGKNIQVSIYEPQLTCLQTKNTDNQKDSTQKISQNSNRPNFLPKKNCNEVKYENCVVFLHANSGSRLQGMQYAKHVLQYRTLCVSFDYTGSGISQGQYTTMGVHESKDLSCVINFISETYKVKKFSLWGRSMGAVTGIYYLLTKYKEDSTRIRVASCIIDSPFSHLQQLIKEIASRKSSLPQFIFQPILKIIQNDIIAKVGVNIFTELNLIEKIKNLTTQETKLINSVSFLGLASKNDTMIDHQHCVDLCSLLIPQMVRRQDMVDEKNYLVANSFDKHFMMLVEFKRQINTKGDFIQIEGNHNKPRSNQVKQKISFFIHENFYSCSNEIQSTRSNQKSKHQRQNLINIAKTGVSIKTKLSFSKATKQPRKDSTVSSEITCEQINTQESLSRLNYNLINLKDIKIKQTKQSLSKDKQTLCNSLTKILVQKDTRLTGAQSTKSFQSGKGLSIVSKELNRQRIALNNNNEDGSKASNKAHEIFPNSRNFPLNKLQSVNNKTSSLQNNNNSHLTGLLGKQYKVEATSKNQNKFTKSPIQRSPPNNYTDHNNESVNNSLKKSQQQKEGDANDRQDVVITPLQLPDNVRQVNVHQNLTQRVMVKVVKGIQSVISDRVIRSNWTKNDISENIQQKTSIVNMIQLSIPSPSSVENTKSINLSITPRDSMNNNNTNDPFKKKQSSQLIMQSTDISITVKQPSKQPQVKLSITEFRNRQQESNKALSATKRSQQPKRIVRKQKNLIQVNTPTTNWTQQQLSMNTILSSTSSICYDGRLSQGKDKLREGENGKKVSIHISDMSCQDSVDYSRVQLPQQQDPNILQHRRQQSYSRNGVNTNTSNYYQQQQQQHNQNTTNVSQSFNNQTHSVVSLKQMMIINGQNKGVTQPTTVNYNNQQNHNYNQQNYHHHNQQNHNHHHQQNPSSHHPHDNRITPNHNPYPYQYLQPNNHYHQTHPTDNSFALINQNQFYPINNNQWQRNIVINSAGKSMHTSHEPNSEEFNRNKQYYCNYNNYGNRISMSAIQTNNAFPQQQQNISQIHHQQTQQFITNPNNPNMWYVPNQGMKQSIEYKKKINKLLD